MVAVGAPLQPLGQWCNAAAPTAPTAIRSINECHDFAFGAEEFLGIWYCGFNDVPG